MYLSKLQGSQGFSPGEEPLQTVEFLRQFRNTIAHPKSMDLGEELIIRDRDGNVRRNVSLDEKIANGDVVFIGYGVLLDKFSAATAAQAVRRTIAAVRVLRDIAGGGRLDWLEDVEEPFGWAT